MDEEKRIEELRDVKQILDDANVKYWLDCGTLLGAVRDKRFILLDTDTDLGAMCIEAHKIIEKIPEIEQKGFKVFVGDFGICMKRDTVPITICLYRSKGDQAWTIIHKVEASKFKEVILWHIKELANRILYRNLSSKTTIKEKIAFALIPNFAGHIIRKFLWKAYGWFGGKYSAYVIPKFYFENLDSMTFYNMTFNVPSHVHDYLSMRYGKDWMKPDPNWDGSNDGAINNTFDIGKREELSIFEC